MSTLVSLALMTSLLLPTIAAPKKVTNLRVEQKTTSSVTLKWKDLTAADRYQVRVMKKNGDLLYKQFTKKRTLEMTGLKADHQYRFKVRAQAIGKQDKTFGKYSKTITAKTKVPSAEDDSINDADNNTDDADDTNGTDGNDSSEEPIPASPVLIGFWGLNGYTSEDGLADVQSRFHSSVFQVAGSASNYTVNTLLPMVKNSGMKITLRLTHDHDAYTTSGNFDLALWKSDLDSWNSYDIQNYIDDGTLVGHMLLDDIDTFSGTDPTAAELDEMARYSQEKFPGLMTFVRQTCSRMPTPDTENGEYQYVDNCVNQYTNYPGYSDGPIDSYVTTQISAADTLGLGMINGLNIVDGGDGSSGELGSRSNHYAMTATEITEYGEALLNVPNLQMFLMWEYDGEQTSWLSSHYTYGADYFDQSALQAALAGLGELAAE